MLFGSGVKLAPIGECTPTFVAKDELNGCEFFGLHDLEATLLTLATLLVLVETFGSAVGARSVFRSVISHHGIVLLVDVMMPWIDGPDTIRPHNPCESIQFQVHVQPGVREDHECRDYFSFLPDPIHTLPLYHGKLSNERRRVPAILEDELGLFAHLTDERDIHHVSVGEKDAHELDLLIH